MSFHDESPGSLFDLMTADVLQAHHARAVEPGLVGAVALPKLDAETAAAAVRFTLELAAKTFGDQLADLVISRRDTFRKVLGPVSLEVADKMLHGLMDLKIALQ